MACGLDTAVWQASIKRLDYELVERDARDAELGDHLHGASALSACMEPRYRELNSGELPG